MRSTATILPRDTERPRTIAAIVIGAALLALDLALVTIAVLT